MNHLKRIAAALPEYGLDAVLVTSDAGERYAVGFHGEGYALITPQGTWYSTDSRYTEAAGKIDGVILSEIGSGRDHASLAAEHIKELGFRRIGIEEEALSLADYHRLAVKMPAGAELLPAQSMMESLRAVKDEEELLRIRRAEEIAERAFLELLNDIHPGVTEQQIAARLTFLMMSYGAQKNAFDPIIASGPNGSMPHAEVTERVIGEGEFVTLDFGAEYEGYCCDTTRTVCVGSPSEEMERVYQTVLRAQQAGIDAIHGGVRGCDVHNAAHDVIRAAGYGDCFGHSFGHSLGIEIHENPVAGAKRTAPLPVNSLITAEPGIYLPGRFGVRIEDLLLVTENGCVNLTAAPKQMLVL